MDMRVWRIDPHTITWLPRMWGSTLHFYTAWRLPMRGSSAKKVRWQSPDIGYPYAWPTFRSIQTFFAMIDLFGRTAPGYPVCAGIDPIDEVIAQDHPRLPRMRGDRPKKRASSFEMPLATPYARGSTYRLLPSVLNLLGYPVCAGIDPESERKRLASGWLPRTRGD